MAEPSYYDLLELTPGASREDIQVAYNKSRAAFSQSSLAVYSLFSAEECQQMQQRIEEAYRTLMNEDARRRYDETLGLAPATSRPASVGPRVAPLERAAIPVRPVATTLRPVEPPRTNGTMSRVPPPPAAPAEELLPEGAVVTGALLRKVRERRGVSLRDISQVTKVNLTYLQFIEEENFQQLPVPAYLRGFLKAYARYLGLDPERVAGEYVKLYALYHEIKGER
jgi:hypothetical protein